MDRIVLHSQPMISEEALDILFRNARTHRYWLDKPVADETIREIYEVMKFAPTSANTNPTRFVFVRTPEAKERLKASLSPGNVKKTMSAPVTAIVAYDLKFFEKLTKLSPRSPTMRDNFASNPQLVETTARRNSS